jgi:hypothetical protein
MRDNSKNQIFIDNRLTVGLFSSINKNNERKKKHTENLCTKNISVNGWSINNCPLSIFKISIYIDNPRVLDSL